MKRIQVPVQPAFKVVISILAIGALLGLAACAGKASAAPVNPTWITPQVNGDTVSMPLSAVSGGKIVHFRVPVAAGGEMYFMAYELNGKQYVRGDACVPCRSTSFSLAGDKLICGSCRTVFSAATGAGVSGVTACQGYPKAAAPFTTANGQLTMTASDLQTAWADTLQPGLP